MPAKSRLERDIDGGGPRGDIYKAIVGFLLMALPALAFIVFFAL